MSDELVVREEQPLTAEKLMQQVNLIQEVMKAVMIGPTKEKPEGVHYGIIPGCGDKPTLLKPGAEKLSLTFRLAPKYEIQINDLAGGHREYEIICNLYHINSERFFGSGVGVCSTLESKYRYRTQNTGREVPQNYWATRDSALLGGSQYSVRKIDKTWFIFEKIDHDNPADYYNTAKKMAKKRAHVDAVLTATGASDIFAQDLEDMEGLIKKPDKEKTKDPIKQPEAKKPGTSANSLVVVDIEGVEQKHGKTKGKPWVLYFINANDKETYSTFSKTLAEEAKSAHEFNKSVEIEYTQTDKGRNLVSISVIDIPQKCVDCIESKSCDSINKTYNQRELCNINA